MPRTFRERLTELWEETGQHTKFDYTDGAPVSNALLDGIDGVVEETMIGMEDAASNKLKLEIVEDLMVDYARDILDFSSLIGNVARADPDDEDYVEPGPPCSECGVATEGADEPANSD